MSASDVWLAMSDLVLDNQRRREVSEALGMSFGRTRALRRLARAPMSMGDSPRRSASTGRTPRCSSQTSRRRGSSSAAPTRPTGARSSSSCTRKGKTLAKRADAILATPPAGLSALSAEDLETLRELLLRVRQLGA